MTEIGNNLNNYNTYPVQRKVPVQVQNRPVIIPDYYVEKESRWENIKEGLEKNPIYTVAVKGFFGEFLEHTAASFVAWLGLSYLLDRYYEGIGGKYETSLLGKAAKFGDNIENSKFIKSTPMQKILGALGVVKNKGKKIVKGNSVLKAMDETPSMPEWSMVKNEMLTQKQRVVEDFVHITQRLHLNGEGFIGLNNLALTKKDKELLKKTFGVSKISSIPEELASNHVLLSRLGVSKDKIKQILATGEGISSTLTKQTILEQMGLDAEKIKLISEDEFGNYADDVLKAAKKVGGKIRIGEGHKSFLGPLSKPFERVISCDQIHNRLYSLGEGAKTGTGRFMSKLIQMFHRGITFGGGKTGVLLFIAPAAVVAGINVHKAENNQKIGTGISSIINSISWVFTFPLALKMMHTLGGAQYAGMGKTKVAKYKDIVRNFNEKNKKGEFKTLKQYSDAKKLAQKKLDKLYNVKGQNIFTRIIRKLARGMTLDLGRFDGYNTGNIITTGLTKARNLPRNIFGVPLRFAIWAGISMGILDTLINKSVKLVFGDSYNAIKEEEIKEAKKEQKKFLKEELQNQLYATQKQKVYNVSNKNNENLNQIQNNMIAHKGGGKNLSALGQHQNHRNPADTYTYVPSQENVIPSPIGKGKKDTYTYIPSQNSTVKGKNGMDNNSAIKRSYIPSQAGANIQKTWDNSGLESALRKADRAENRAMRILAGDFEGM